MESTKILRPIEKVVYWRLARWMIQISELKSERSSCYARLRFLSGQQQKAAVLDPRSPAEEPCTVHINTGVGAHFT